MTALRWLSISAALFLGAAAAQAHAQLERADPRVGSVIDAAPAAITLSFTEGIEPAFSAVEVTDSSGRRFDAGKVRVDRGNPSQAQISLKALPAGRYTVRWRVLSRDAHRTEGSFTFEVRP